MLLVFLAALCVVASCSPQASERTPAATIAPQAPVATPSASATDSAEAPEQEPGDGLSAEERRALGTLRQLDRYPFYTMCLCGQPAAGRRGMDRQGEDAATAAGTRRSDDVASEWGCSLFAALGDPEGLLYGRNFDWTTSPALLLFSDPLDGYASVAMVDITYLGFDGEAAAQLADLPLPERRALLDAPALPFDGMNEEGLVVGMAAVPEAQMPADPEKETVGSLMLMRLILEQARDVDEALAVVERYNIDFGGGPPIHYLLADAMGRAVLVEFYEGRMVVLPNQRPWHLATNFLRAAVDGPAEGRCWRYDRLSERLEQAQGQLDAAEAMELLQHVAQPNTQWSVVYDMAGRQVHVALGRGYGNVYTLPFELCGPSCGQ